MDRRVVCGDNMEVLSTLGDESIDLIYIDPPFNTGNTQRRRLISYEDSFLDFGSYIRPRIEQSYRVLKSTGSLFFHIDYRESHYCKIWLDELFGRDNFRNEIIWAYDYGARSRKKWSTKHDNIFWYSKTDEYTFNYEEMERIPYMAPGLQKDKNRAEKGKTPNDVWWHTIVPTAGKEKTGYPTQKPLGILNRIIKVHSNPGDMVLDFFAGSGTTGVSAYNHDRQFLMIDSNPVAISTMKRRFREVSGIEFDTIDFVEIHGKEVDG